MLIFFLYLLIAYIFISKILPYFLYPNYFLKAKVENYPDLVKQAQSLKDKDKIATLKNVYDYMTNQYIGDGDVYNLRTIPALLSIGDFNTKGILNKKTFLLCHTQNKMVKSLLVDTGMFDDDEITIQIEFLKHIYIHQWVLVKTTDLEIKVDPFFKKFEILKNKEW